MLAIILVPLAFLTLLTYGSDCFSANSAEWCRDPGESAQIEEVYEDGLGLGNSVRQRGDRRAMEALGARIVAVAKAEIPVIGEPAKEDELEELDDE